MRRGAQPLTLAGFIDDNLARTGESFAGSRILGGSKKLDELRALGVRRIHVAVGHCATRMRIAETIVAGGFSLLTVVHPQAVIGDDVSIDDGCFVAPGVVVNAGTSVGKNVILNTSSSVDHECSIADGVHVAPGGRLAGLVQVGQETFIGIGAVVLNCLRIGERTIVGAGAVVARDLPAGVVAYGVPARVVRSRGSTE